MLISIALRSCNGQMHMFPYLYPWFPIYKMASITWKASETINIVNGLELYALEALISL